jgi:hypothetical protein
VSEETSIAALVIRAWVEKGSSPSLRARVTSTTDVLTGRETRQVFTSIDEVSEAVRTWLGTVAQAPDREAGDNT